MHASTISCALGALLLAASAHAQSEAAATRVPDELVAALEALVDLPTPRDRARAAAVLAKDERYELDTLVAAMRAFGRFELLAPGVRSERVELQVGADVEATDMHLYVPSFYDPAQPTPLLLSFHGTGGEGAQAVPMWRATAEELGMLVLAPSEAGANEGYAFSARERDAALAALRWIRRRANVDENRVFLTGVSRGGHLAWDLALRHPDRFAALAPMIGSPRMAVVGTQNNVRYLENVAHLPIRDLQGALDDPGLVFNLREAFARLEKLRAVDAELIVFEELGHSFELGAVDWNAFFGAAKREPYPAHAVRLTARADEGRASFVDVLELERTIEEEFRPQVEAERWNALDDAGRKLYLQELADERTARLAARRIAPGEYELETRGVRKFRILIPAEEFDPTLALTLRIDGKTQKKRAKASKLVLLEDFAERFDRTFLPVAAIELR